MTHNAIPADIAAIFAAADQSNKGVNREWALCRAFGIERIKHDSVRFDKGSDIELDDGRNISVKYGGFSLMAGSCCEGETTMEGIWNVYERRVHSNWFAYVTETYEVFLMNLAEFKEFIMTFGKVQRESKANGGQLKVKCDKETKKRVAWLMARAGA